MEIQRLSNSSWLHERRKTEPFVVVLLCSFKLMIAPDLSGISRNNFLTGSTSQSPQDKLCAQLPVTQFLSLFKNVLAIRFSFET